jgi:hypothetical protein
VSDKEVIGGRLGVRSSGGQRESCNDNSYCEFYFHGVLPFAGVTISNAEKILTAKARKDRKEECSCYTQHDAREYA